MKIALMVLSILVGFNAVAAPQITITEINGVKWSQVLDDSYRNENLCWKRPINGIIQKSNATEACAALGNGWHLPTKEDFEKLGDDYKKIPGITNFDLYWSSTVDPDFSGDAFALAGDSGTLVIIYGRDTPVKVVCTE